MRDREFECIATVRLVIRAGTVHSATALVDYYLERNARRQGYIAAAEIVDQTVTEAGAGKADETLDKGDDS